ncbi:MAG: tetratricopeptide repeat protein [Gammaproteobacteria bacterium]|nr:tetratricopeptide repeat protein [Gammaproteobacteria bacterium]
MSILFWPMTGTAQLTLKRMGRTGQAEAALRTALDMQLKVLGDRHPYTVMTMYTLAHLLQQDGRIEQAIALHERAIAGMKPSNRLTYAWL